MPKHAAPRPSPAATSIILGPYRSARRLTKVTRMALTMVLTASSAEIPVRDSPMSSIMESRKTEKTKDWPGPLLNMTTAAAPTMNHP